MCPSLRVCGTIQPPEKKSPRQKHSSGHSYILKLFDPQVSDLRHRFPDRSFELDSKLE